MFNKADSSTLDCRIPVLTTTTTPRDQHYLPYLNYDIKDDNTQPHVELSAELQKQPFSRNPFHKTSPCIESRVQLQKQSFSRNLLHETSPCVESSCVQLQKLQSFSRNSLHETSPCVETSVQLQNQPFSRNSSLETSPLIPSKPLPQPRDKHTVQLLPTSQKQDSSSNRFSSGLENLKLVRAKLAHLAYAQGTQDASKTKMNKKEQADEGGYERIQSAKLVHKEEDPSHSELENQSWSNYHQFPRWKTETDNKPLKVLHLPNSPSWSGYTVRGLNSPPPPPPPLPPPSQPPLRRHKPSCPSRKTEIATCRMHNPSCPNFQKEVVGPLQLSPGPPPRSHEQLNVSSGSNGPLTNTAQNLPSCRHKPTCIFSQPDQRPQRIHHPNCINAPSNAHMS